MVCGASFSTISENGIPRNVAESLEWEMSRHSGTPVASTKATVSSGSMKRLWYCWPPISHGNGGSVCAAIRMPEVSRRCTASAMRSYFGSRSSGRMCRSRVNPPMVMTMMGSSSFGNQRFRSRVMSIVRCTSAIERSHTASSSLARSTRKSPEKMSGRWVVKPNGMGSRNTESMSISRSL